MFELHASYLRASWWVVDRRMAGIGQQGMAPGISVQRTTNSEVERARGIRLSNYKQSMAVP